MTRLNQLGKIRRFGLLGSIGLVGHAIRYYAGKYLMRRRSIVRRIHNYKLRLDLYDSGLSKDIAVRGTREEQLKYIIDREVNDGDVILDVGANIGYYAIMLAKKVGSKGKVYAIEPEPNNMVRLEENIRLNGVNSIVEPFKIGAADNIGIGKLHVSKFSNLHSFFQSEYGIEGHEPIEVPLTDISSFIKGKRTVDLLRMDVEGYEVEVINGLERAIKNGSWTGGILFECHYPTYDDATHSMRAPLRMLFKHGYQAKYLTSSDENKPRIRNLGYQPVALVQTNDTRYRGIYRDISNKDTEMLICNTGGVRDAMMVKT